MHCDCVHSFIDGLQDGEESHESESDYEDQEENENDPNSTSLTMYDPDSLALVPITPSKNKRPWLQEDNALVLVDKPVQDYDGPADVPVTPSPAKKPKPGTDPDLTNPGDVMENYYSTNSGKVPRPFLTTPRTTDLIGIGMPVNTGPYDPNDTAFMQDLWDWYSNLSPENKQLYNGACFVASDPRDAQGNGDVGDFFVSVKENPKNENSRFEYGVEYPNGDYIVIKSDIRLPPRAFSGNESIDEFFFKDGPYYRPKYKFGRSRSGKKDPFYVGDDMGSRMARNPNQWGGLEPSSDIPANPDIAEPDVVSPPLPPTVLQNNSRNTRAFTGSGTRTDPFSCRLGAVNCTKWATFTNSSSNGAGDDAFGIGQVSDNQGDPAFTQLWYSGTTNHCAYIMLHEMINKNGSNPTFGLCGFSFTSTANQTFVFNCLTISRRFPAGTCSNSNSIFHEVLINGVSVRSLSATNDITLTVNVGTTYTIQALVRCDPNDNSFNKADNGQPYVYFWPKSTLRAAKIIDIWQCVKTNSLVAVGEPDNPPGNPSFINGENVSWGSECPTSYLARNNGTLPNNQQMVLVDDILSKLIIFRKATGTGQCRVNFRNQALNILKSRPLLFVGPETTIPFCNGTESSDNQNFQNGSIGTYINGLKTVRIFNPSQTAQTDDTYEREYSYVVYNDNWLP